MRVFSLARILRGVQLLHIAGLSPLLKLVANGRQLVFGFSDQGSGSTNSDSKEKRVTDGRGRS